MTTRRDVLLAVAGIGLADTGSAQPADFDALFAQAMGNEALLDSTRTQREGLLDLFDRVATRAVAPRQPPSNRHISAAATNLIVLFEVTGEKVYDKKYQRAVWPGGASGVTIGVGYDLGYVTRKWLKEDWASVLNDQELKLMQQACGLRGDAAAKSLMKFKSVEIPWSKAHPQFTRWILPRWVAETTASLPNCDKLSNDSLGALVSLTYNRGSSFRKAGTRYTEMRAIRQHMVNGTLAEIPAALRSMKRLWKNDKSMAGLVVRRDLEAALFERGLGR